MSFPSRFSATGAASKPRWTFDVVLSASFSGLGDIEKLGMVRCFRLWLPRVWAPTLSPCRSCAVNDTIEQPPASSQVVVTIIVLLDTTRTSLIGCEWNLCFNQI